MSIDVRVIGSGESTELELLLSEPELALLRSLLEQFTTLLAEDAASDPAVRRLFPDGYRNDPEAAAEFARYTRAGLAERKSASASALLRALEPGTRLRAPRAEFESWLPLLTDLRLVLAERLGIHHDGDRAEGLMGEVYDWLGALQWNLVAAIDADAGGA